MRRKLILSLDVGDPAEALSILRECRDYCDIVKVGSPLFLLGGARIIRNIRDLGKEVFLDLKFHDIPNTVAQAGCRAVDLDVFMFDVHTSGGSAMMKTVVEEVGEYSRETGRRQPLILGVTVLTSIDQKSMRKDLGYRVSVSEHVVSLALKAKGSGLDGTISSAHEIRKIKMACGEKFLIVVPGIRPDWIKDDQKRTATPGEAIRAGADYIVVGRPILKAKDRVKTCEGIIQEIQEAEVSRE